MYNTNYLFITCEEPDAVTDLQQTQLYIFTTLF